MYKCAICGQYLEFISEYHCNTHDITKDEYVEKYGLKKIKFNEYKHQMFKNKNKRTEVEQYLCERSDRVREKLIKEGRRKECHGYANI